MPTNNNKVFPYNYEAGPTKNNHGPHLLRDFIAEVSSASVSPLIMACKRYLAAKVINNKVGGKGDEQ